MTTLCLTMIVKNEAHVLARSVASVRPLVSSFCIVDTGSSDATVDVARVACAGLPGLVDQRPWINFAHNRTQAFELGREFADYQLVLDADDTLEFASDFTLPHLDADVYRLPVRDSDTRYERRQIFRSAIPWRYEGVLHEYATCPGLVSESLLSGVTYVRHSDGARSRSTTKYADDAALLERALRDEPENARYQFYLAQSYRDHGELAKALAAYERRVLLGGWDEEVYVSLLNMARLQLRLGQPTPIVRDAFLRAYNHRPSRAEALVDLAAYCRERAEWSLAFLFAKKASELATPSDILFVEPAAYRWRAIDELAVAAFYVGDRELAVRLNQRLLAEGFLPQQHRARIQANLAFG